MGEVPAAVVHEIAVIVLEDGDVSGSVALPGRVGFEGDFLGDGAVEAQLGVAGEGGDEIVVDEQLAAGADVDSRAGLNVGE